jgi:hypothetical protein
MKNIWSARKIIKDAGFDVDTLELMFEGYMEEETSFSHCSIFDAMHDMLEDLGLMRPIFDKMDEDLLQREDMTFWHAFYDWVNHVIFQYKDRK